MQNQHNRCSNEPTPIYKLSALARKAEEFWCPPASVCGAPAVQRGAGQQQEEVGGKGRITSSVCSAENVPEHIRHQLAFPS